MSRGGGHRSHARSDSERDRGLCGASSPHGLTFADDFPAPWVDCKNCLAIIAEDNAAWRAGVKPQTPSGLQSASASPALGR